MTQKLIYELHQKLPSRGRHSKVNGAMPEALTSDVVSKNLSYSTAHGPW